MGSVTDLKGLRNSLVTRVTSADRALLHSTGRCCILGLGMVTTGLQPVTSGM